MTRYASFILLLLSLPAHALTFTSSEARTQMIMLFTSEGCSSCPPADAWLSQLKNDPTLFTKRIPMALHVDYWDSLGWPDPYASPQHSQFQRQLVQQGYLSQVYTPGLIVDSQEWRGWFRGQSLMTPPSKTVGVLSGQYENGHLTARYAQSKSLTLHVALLGMGLVSEIDRGENRGRTLTHDFVVLEQYSTQGQGKWNMTLPAIPDKGQNQTALVIWLTEKNDHQVIQATGTWLVP
jgi:hypothetical protein